MTVADVRDSGKDVLFLFHLVMVSGGAAAKRSEAGLSVNHEMWLTEEPGNMPGRAAGLPRSAMSVGTSPGVPALAHAWSKPGLGGCISCEAPSSGVGNRLDSLLAETVSESGRSLPGVP